MEFIFTRWTESFERLSLFCLVDTDYIHQIVVLRFLGYHTCSARSALEQHSMFANKFVENRLRCSCNPYALIEKTRNSYQEKNTIDISKHIYCFDMGSIYASARVVCSLKEETYCATFISFSRRSACPHLSMR